MTAAIEIRNYREYYSDISHRIEICFSKNGHETQIWFTFSYCWGAYIFAYDTTKKRISL